MERDYDYWRVAKELEYDFNKLESMGIETFDKLVSMLAMEDDYSAARNAAEESWSKKKK